MIKYESKYLKQMGQAMDYLLSIAMSAAAQETLKYTVLSGIAIHYSHNYSPIIVTNIVTNIPVVINTVAITLSLHCL